MQTRHYQQPSQQQQANHCAAKRLAVTYERDCTANPPVAVKEAFYQIAQEAFNNIAKHAEATQVMVRLECQPGRAELWLQDNFIGYVITESGMLLGALFARRKTWWTNDEIFIDELFIKPDHQRQASCSNPSVCTAAVPRLSARPSKTSAANTSRSL
jgi:hypothetical protein